MQAVGAGERNKKQMEQIFKQQCAGPKYNRINNYMEGKLNPPVKRQNKLSDWIKKNHNSMLSTTNVL